MFQIVSTKARLDFTLKTIEFDGDFSLADLHLIQEALNDWKEWRVVQPPRITMTPMPEITPWITPGWYCQNCAASHPLGSMCPLAMQGTWIATVQTQEAVQ